MLSRKHYKVIAKSIKDSTTLDAYGDEIVHKEDLINDLCIMFKRDNSLFSSDKFINACNEVDDDFDNLSPREQAEDILLNDIKYLDNEL